MDLGTYLPTPGSDPVDVVDAVATWSAASGRELYPHQLEAALALSVGDHVILATPTGSGKSLVATVAMALALNAGERAVWTAPIKALVTEKFFDLVALFGAHRVGLATGDAVINGHADLLVCTAEVLANQALGADAGFGLACLDEFHYYADRDRGWAWQIPLLEMTRCQFLLASATLGETRAIAQDLQTRSGRAVTAVVTAHRPTPLYHRWRTTPVAESVKAAIEDGLSPVYVVHSTQAAAIQRAQALTSLALTDRGRRDAIGEALAGIAMTSGFGQTLSRLIRNGVGVHHAGMLPRHRRLVERLAAEGLLAVICGTDTLGVGVNIPIRTVVMTGLTKYDGAKVRVYSAREFHQLAGRAGRPGFDPDGHIWVQAPEHVIDNQRALDKAGDDPRARRRATRAKAPEGFVHYDEATLQRLVAATPEPLVSRFRVTTDLVATVLARPDGPDALKHLLATNHDPIERRRQHKRRALAVYRSLEAAGVARRRRDLDGRCLGVEIGALDEGCAGDGRRSSLRFSSPLSLFAVEVIDTFDTTAPDHHLDVVSVIESITEDPRPILLAQRDRARAAAIAQMKADGVAYEERIERLEGIEWPRPLAPVIEACFDTYRAAHPWIDSEPSPKSIVREMYERGDTFTTFVQRYQLTRSEGSLLRYLSDVWRLLERSLPDGARVSALNDVAEWLGTLIRTTDATLLEEWELLARLESGAAPEPPDTVESTGSPSMTADGEIPPAWRTAVRTVVFRWVELLAARSSGLLADRCANWSASQIDDAMAPYWAEYDHLAIDADARSAQWFELVEDPPGSAPQRWMVTQILVDPDNSGCWRLTASVDLAEARLAGAPTPVLESIGPVPEPV